MDDEAMQLWEQTAEFDRTGSRRHKEWLAETDERICAEARRIATEAGSPVITEVHFGAAVLSAAIRGLPLTPEKQREEDQRREECKRDAERKEVTIVAGSAVFGAAWSALISLLTTTDLPGTAKLAIVASALASSLAAGVTVRRRTGA